MGMVTVFCSHNWDKMEASDALSALHQCDSLEPSVVVVRRYTNTPYILQGNSWLLYLDVSTLSEALPPFSSLWTAYAYESYFHTPRLRCSYFMKRKILGFKDTPHQTGSMEKLLRGVLPPWPSATINPLIWSPPSSSRSHSDRGRTRLQPSCLVHTLIVGPSWRENMDINERNWPKKVIQPSKRSLQGQAWQNK